MSRETGSHAPDSEQKQKPKQVTQKIGALTRKVSDTREPGVLSNETQGAWTKSEKSEMEDIHTEAEKAIDRLATPEEVDKAWMDESLTETETETAPSTTSPEAKLHKTAETIKDLEAKMDAVEDPFSDEFLQLATEYNKLDQQFRKMIMKQVKEMTPTTKATSSLEILTNLNSKTELDTPLVTESEIRTWRTNALDSTARQEMALRPIIAAISKMEKVGKEENRTDQVFTDELNSLDEDGKAIAKAWVEKQKSPKLPKTIGTKRFADLLYKNHLISESDHEIFSIEETTDDMVISDEEEKATPPPLPESERNTQKVLRDQEAEASAMDLNEFKVEEETPYTRFKKASNAESAAALPELNEAYLPTKKEDEILDSTPEMMTEKGSLTSEQVLHKEYQRIREMMDTDPRLEPLKDELENLLGFPWNDVKNPPKKSFFKGLTDKILGTPSIKEQRLQAVAEASYLVSNLMRTPRARDSAVSKAREDLAKQKKTLN